MEHDDQTKLSFTTKGAWLGLVAYLVLVCVVVLIFTFG